MLNYNTYNQPMVLFDIMGLGRSMDDVPLLLSPGVLTSAWGGTVRQIAAGILPRASPVSPNGTNAAPTRGLRHPRRDGQGGDRGRDPISRCAAWWATVWSLCSST